MRRARRPLLGPRRNCACPSPRRPSAQRRRECRFLESTQQANRRSLAGRDCVKTGHAKLIASGRHFFRCLGEHLFDGEHLPTFERRLP
jgi:hypothetical protein